ncbi:MAG: hypothetical protein ABW196_11780 [Solirubrobacterales bacterium]
MNQFGSQGPGAGQLSLPAGLATDPITGHVFTADTANYRISEFTPWGKFVKAFGWDVAPGAVNEQQEVRVRAAEGQFKLTFGATTTDLAFDAPGSESEGPGSVEAALNALPSIGGAGGDVDVETIPGTPDGKTPSIYVIVFKGSLAGANVDQITISNGTAELKGGIPSTSFEARTRADGTPGGAGLESCTAESGCKAGLKGSGAGQFASDTVSAGIAVDAAGSVYVREITDAGDNGRVQKFDPAGRFLLMFGGEVNKTTNENRCTKAQLEGGDVCGIGVVGTGNGQFAASYAPGFTLDSSGKLLVGDVERIQRFNSEGEYEATVPVSGKTVHKFAISPSSGDFYAAMGGPAGPNEADVRILDSTTGDEVGQLKGAGGGLGGDVATDSTGNVFFSDGNQVLQYGESGKPLSPPSCCQGSGGTEIRGLSTNAAGDLYVAYNQSNAQAFIRLYGPAPVRFEGAPRVPPGIVAQFASSVDRSGATVAADINPHFWTDTRYYVEYGTGKCSEGGCTETKPVPPGALLTTKVTDDPVQSAGIALEGLAPGMTYHYRFVTESLGGGPVRGAGGEVGLDGEENSFTTYPVSAPAKTDCQNQAFRIGFSAPLADCRAYEMVSPVDKNNGDIKALLGIPSYPTAFTQSATDGSRFTYSSYRGFGELKSAPYTSQYLASREQGVGWSSETLNVAQTGVSEGNRTFENQHKLFSPDLCQSWLIALARPALDPDASEGYNNIYRREGCGGGGYEALIGTQPSIAGGSHATLFMQGASSEGKEAVFMVRDKLTEDAASGVSQAYYASNGGLRLLCVLPNGSPSGGNCSAGTSQPANDAVDSFAERKSTIHHALSGDGAKAYWTDSAANESGPGKVYLRLNPGEEQSALSGSECTEAEKACTVKVSETKTPQPSRFLDASADGSKAIFEVTAGALKGDLYLFDAETQSSTLIAESRGLVAASEDLARIYFLSEGVLAPGAVAGEPNLYLEEEGAKTYVATIAEEDVDRGIIGGEGMSVADSQPVFHAPRATPDGRVLAFISARSLTGYDNTDLHTGRADIEVYRYEVGSPGPVCVSCNPSGGRPLGRAVKTPRNSAIGQPIAAWLTMPMTSLHHPRVLTPDGRRLFFNSYDALLLRDTNGKADVYEWEAATGQKECDERGAELYVPSSGGCINLITSGQSPEDSELLDISANGNDAFFTTNSSLLPQDPGLVDVYDARVNGGLPASPEPPGPCQGEACQFAPPPPNDPTPASASFRGVGNPSASKPRPRCAKGKARRKGRCVAKRKGSKKAAKRKRAANTDRRTSR